MVVCPNVLNAPFRYGTTNSGFDVLLESVIGQFYKQSDLDDVRIFFGNKSELGSAEHGVKKGRLNRRAGAREES